MAAKRMSRKELLKKDDKFLIFLNNLWKTINDNKKPIFIGIGIFIAVVVGFYSFRIYLENRKDSAFAMLENTQKMYIEAVDSKSLKEGYEKSKESFERLFKKFSKTPAAELGQIIYGNLAYLTEDYETAYSIYKKALNNFDDKELYKNIILSNIAYTCLKIGKEEEAVEFFEKIASGNNSIMKDSAFVNLGILYAKKDDKQKSIEKSEQITFMKDSMFAPMIKEELGMIY